MRKKVALLLLLVCVMLTAQMVIADDIYEKTTMSLFQGGWNHYKSNEGYHWTSYAVNAPIAVTAYIRVGSNLREGVTKGGNARVTSSHLAGPYVDHTHSYDNPGLTRLWGITEFTPIERGIK